tara:strand:+ start:588 stop:806 length:219 start_codon:yes stop_codon:yes gene_type:complete
MSKKPKLVGVYYKIPQELKDKLQDQAKIERIPVATLVCDMLELSLAIRPKVRQDRLDKLVNSARGMVSDVKR